MRWSSIVVAFAAVVLMAGPSAAESSVRAEAGASLALSAPQRSYFGIGGGGLLGLQVELAPFMDLTLNLAGAVLPPVAGAPVSGPGTAFTAGAGLRFRRPWSQPGLIPWADVTASYVLTGGLSRMAAHAGAGLLFRVGEEGSIAIGPAVRFMEIFKLFDLPGVLNADAQLLTFGLALELPSPVTVAHEELAGPDVDRCNGPVEQRPESCAVRDTDGDGVPDVDDACPTEKGIKGLKGCPDLDADNDGIKLPRDQCPDEPEDKDGYRDEDGCPDPDNDKDGVLDADDQCPLQAGPATLKGCPDADGDGVPDKDDACPLKPGPKEEGGCPVYKQIKVTETHVELLQKIQFAFGKALILSKSYGLLDEAVQALKDHPLICVRIEGHTDNVGNPKRNFTLSEDRALAVMKYLTDHGVDPLRVIGQGFGQEKPLEPNTTAEGRERNRRVEFVIRPCDAALSAPPTPPSPPAP